MDYSIFQSVWTIVVLVLFVGIVVWAWSSKRKQGFDEAANIPFEEEDDLPAEKKSTEDSHG